MTTELIFEEPPQYTPKGRPSIWPERLRSLRVHPGEWVNATATWGCKQSVIIYKPLKRGTGGLVADEYELTQRGQTVFVRYIGGAS